MPKEDQGINRYRYHIIPRTLIFLFRDDEVLLIKGTSSKPIWPGLYNGIGGHIERGESVIQSARRELAEEAGLRNQSLWICGNILVDSGDEHTGIGLFVMKGIFINEPISPSGEGNLYWVGMSQLDSYPLVEDLGELLPNVYRQAKSDPPFSASYSYNEFSQLITSFQ